MYTNALEQWIEDTVLSGGIHQEDTVAAIRAASDFCWKERDRFMPDRNDIAQLGLKWVAAFMVSCVKHGVGPKGEGQVSSLIAPLELRRAMFFREAMREGNDGVVRVILLEAAQADEDGDEVMAQTGLILRIAPTGRGKGVGRIFRRRS